MGPHKFQLKAGHTLFMGIPNIEKALKQIFDVLKNGGFLQFSITHPCFWRQNMNWVKDQAGIKIALLCDSYFVSPQKVIGKWMFDGVDPAFLEKEDSFETPLYHRTLSNWFNALSKVGFQVEEVNEPQISEQLSKDYPSLGDARVIPFLLLVRVRKTLNVRPHFKLAFGNRN